VGLASRGKKLPLRLSEKAFSPAHFSQRMRPSR
jgi:hypothetical protein